MPRHGRERVPAAPILARGLALAYGLALAGLLPQVWIDGGLAWPYWSRAAVAQDVGTDSSESQRLAGPLPYRPDEPGSGRLSETDLERAVDIIADLELLFATLSQSEPDAEAEPVWRQSDVAYGAASNDLRAAIRDRRFRIVVTEGSKFALVRRGDEVWVDSDLAGAWNSERVRRAREQGDDWPDIAALSALLFDHWRIRNVAGTAWLNLQLDRLAVSRAELERGGPAAAAVFTRYGFLKDIYFQAVLLATVTAGSENATLWDERAASIRQDIDTLLRSLATTGLGGDLPTKLRDGWAEYRAEVEGISVERGATALAAPETDPALSRVGEVPQKPEQRPGPHTGAEADVDAPIVASRAAAGETAEAGGPEARQPRAASSRTQDRDYIALLQARAADAVRAAEDAKRQADALARQADAANLAAEEARVALAAAQSDANGGTEETARLRQEAADLAARLAEAEERADGAEKAAADAEAARQAAESQAAGLESDLATAQSKTESSAEETARLRRETAELTEQLAAAEERASLAEAAAAEAETGRQAAENQVAELEAQLAAARSETEGTVEETALLRQEAADLTARLAEAQAQASAVEADARSAAAEAAEEIAELEAQLAAARSEGADAATEIERLQGEAAGLASQLAEAETGRQAAESQVAEVSSQLAAAQAAAEGGAEETARLRQEAADLAAQLADAQAQASAAAADAQSAAAEAAEEIAALRQQFAGRDADLARAEAQAASQETALTEARAEAGRLERQIAAQLAAVAEADEAKAALAAAEDRAGSEAARADRAEAEAAAASEATTAAQRDLAKREAELASLREELSTLRQASQAQAEPSETASPPSRTQARFGDWLAPVLAAVLLAGGLVALLAVSRRRQAGVRGAERSASESPPATVPAPAAAEPPGEPEPVEEAPAPRPSPRPVAAPPRPAAPATPATLVEAVRRQDWATAEAQFAQLSGVTTPGLRDLLADPSGELLALACRAAELDRLTFAALYLLQGQGRGVADPEVVAGAVGLFERTGPAEAQRRLAERRGGGALPA